MIANDIRPIDLLVVNLYPFEAALARGAAFDDMIENIDIGGPAMIRAAAKNHADVAVIVDVADYDALLAEMAANDGGTTATFRRAHGAEGVCAHRRLRRGDLELARPRDRRDAAGLARLRRQARLGDCATARIRTRTRRSIVSPDARPGVATARQVQGKELSYNNINDTDAAYECVAEFTGARRRHHQARQPLRRRGRRDVARGLREGAGLRSRLRLRRRRGAEPHARRRAPRERSSRSSPRSSSRPTPTPRRSRSSRAKKNLRLLLAGGLPDPTRAGPDGALGRRRPAGAGPRQRRARRGAACKVVTKRAPSEAEMARPAIRVARLQARQVERHRLRQGRRDGRHRRRADEPRRFLARRRAQGRGRRAGRRSR